MTELWIFEHPPPLLIVLRGIAAYDELLYLDNFNESLLINPNGAK